MNSWKLIIFIGVNIICCAAYYQQQANNNINVNGNLNYKNLRLIYSWKTLDFLFPNDFTREQAILNGNYIPGAPFPIDVDASDGMSIYFFIYLIESETKFCFHCAINKQINTKLFFSVWSKFQNSPTI